MGEDFFEANVRLLSRTKRVDMLRLIKVDLPV